MHILLCIPSLTRGKGGAERVAAELGLAMTERGHKISFAYKISPMNPKGLPQYTVPEESHLLIWDNTLQGIQSFRKKVFALHPDLILVFYASWHVIEIYNLLYDLGIPLCFQECSNPQRILYENWENASNASMMRDEILSDSVGIRVTQRAYKKNFNNKLQDLVHCFPNAFKISVNNAQVPLVQKNILHVGSAKPNKQVGFILEAFKIICSQFPDWTLVLCTAVPRHENIFYKDLTNKIQTVFSPGRVLLMENINDMDSIYKKTGIHCITSLSEGLPNCVCEAMCHGIPSIGYEDSIGTNLLIKHGVNGLLSSAAPRADSLASALATLMENDKLRRELGANAWEQAAQFNPAIIYDAWENFFVSSLERASMRSPKKFSHNTIKRICIDYSTIHEYSWREYIVNKVDSLSDGDVVFFGCGKIYNEFKYLFSRIIPKCILVDKIDGTTSIDGIDVVELNSFTNSLYKYKIVIFSMFARVIEHRLRMEYGVMQDIICIDERMYQDKNISINFLLKKNYMTTMKNINSKTQKYDKGLIQKLAFIISPYALSYFSPVIRCLPFEIVDVYLSPVPLSTENVVSFNTLNKQIFAHITNLMDEKYSVSPLISDSLCTHKTYVVDRYLYSHIPIFKYNNSQPTTFMALTHAVDASFTSGTIAARLYIAASRRQARHQEDSKVARDSQFFKQLMRLPCEMRNEYAYSGPYHIGEWVEKRHWPKDRLRCLLEEKIGSALDARKPVVAFLLDEVSHLGQVVSALERLAPLVNLVVKMLPVPGMAPPVRGAHVWPSDDGFAPNLLRFAADFILAGYHSGTLASSTMLGLSAIPYYTPLTYAGGRGKGKKKLGNHKIYMPGNFAGDNICIDILEYLNPPINLMDTSAILDRMENHSWWSDYAARLPAAQKNIFGDYSIDNAASKTAALLVRAVTHGTFGADADAVRLRPEYGSLVQDCAVARDQGS